MNGGVFFMNGGFFYTWWVFFTKGGFFCKWWGVFLRVVGCFFVRGGVSFM